MIWNDDADQLLIKLWDEGGSLGYVADAMRASGYVVTRNAVAGRKHRLSVTNFRRATISIKTRPIKPDQPINPPRRKKMSNKVTTGPAEIDPNWQGIDYLDLKPNGCKAILGFRGGEWMLQKVCGKPRGKDANGNRSSYCPGHTRLYSNSPQPQRRANG